MTVYAVRGVSLDSATRQVTSDDVAVELSRKQFDGLLCLIRRAGTVVSRETIMHEVWNATFWTSTKTIDVHMGWLRRNLGDDPRQPRLIATVRGLGYRFEKE